MGWDDQQQRQRTRLGWTLAGVGALAACAALLWRAVRANDTDFERLVGWANILALVVAGLGMALVCFDRTRRRVDTSPKSLTGVTTNLTAVVLAGESKQRGRLLGAGSPDTARINIEFYRDMVRFRAAGGGRMGDLESVLGYYQSLVPRRLVFIGEAGSGKTVLALHLLVSLLEQPDKATMPVPLRLTLSGFDTAKTLDQWLADELADRFNLSPVVAEALVRDRRILPVLDGLDEMDLHGEDPVRANAAAERINEYLHGTERAPVIVTCRKRRYEDLAEPILDATIVEIQPLAPRQIHAYLRAQLRDEREEAAWAPILDPLARDPQGGIAGALTTILPTPWRLNLAVTAVRGGMDPAVLLPPSTGTVVTNHARDVTARLLERIVPAATRLHPRRSGVCYDPRKIEKWLRAIASNLASQDQRGTSSSDIVLHRWWHIAGTNRVRYLHAAINVLLWYAFAVVFSSVVAGRPGGVSINVHRYLTITPPLDRSFIVGGSFLAFIVIVVPWAAARSGRAHGLTPRRLNVLQLQSRAARHRLMSWLTLGLGSGVVLGVIAGLGFGAAFGWGFGLGVGIVTSLGGLLAGLSSELTGQCSPRDVVRDDTMFGVAAGLVFGSV